MKKSISDLAIFGGQPLFRSIRPIGQLATAGFASFSGYAKKMYAARQLTNNGPLVKELEHRLSNLHNVKYCVANCNAYVASLALLKILKPDPGGEVVMPAFTYPGLPHIAQWAGLIPKFCDIDSKTHTIALDSLADVITDETVAILGVHQVNSPCFIDEMQSIADQSNIPLIFDSVHGIGCTYQGRSIGGFGMAEVFSLHATKLINGFEGGYITTNNETLAKELQLKRTFGFVSKDTVATLGLNGKLNEMHAAMALTALEIMDQTIDKNRYRYECYNEFFLDIPGCSIIQYPVGERYNYEYSILEIDSSWSLDRNNLVSILRQENALAQPYYSPPLHLSSHMPKDIPIPSLPVTEDMATRFIQMPVGDFVDKQTIKQLAMFMMFLRNNDRKIVKRLAK